MPTTSDLLDTRSWYPGVERGKGLEGLAPGEAIPAEPKVQTYTVTFLDLATRGYKARTHVQLDCEPLMWTQILPRGLDGYTKRTWLREFGDAGTVYREIAPARFVPTAYKPGGGVPKGKRPRIIPDVEPVGAEEWA